MSFKPTKEQQDVIDSKSHNLLVSASAGSGKTATIIEKIIDLIVKDNLSLHDLLMITFTESASLEMKIRLKTKLYEKAKDNINAQKQINELSTSDICTIHSFCSKMLRKYFYLLGLNANFSVLDENNAKYLKSTALDKVIRDYSKNKDDNFVKLVSIFGGGRNFIKFREVILNYYEFLSSIKDRDDFISNKLICSYEQNLDENRACNILNDYLFSNVKFYIYQFSTYLKEANFLKADYFVEFLEKTILLLKQFEERNNFIKNFEILSVFEPLRISTKKMSQENTDFRDLFKSFYKSFCDQFKEIKNFILLGDKNEIVKSLNDTKEIILHFQEVENAFENEYKILKTNKNVLDFSDLEKYFLKLLENDEIKKAISNSYKYIFVDEYQDINIIQETILSKLTNGNNYMVMVGDVKQSIYGFRNSTPSIFVEKNHKYKKENSLGIVIDLNDNFRSNPIVLNFINSIFSKTMYLDFGGVDYKNTSLLNGRTPYQNCEKIPTINLCLINTIDDEIENEQNLKEKNLNDKKEKINIDLTKSEQNKIEIVNNNVEKVCNNKKNVYSVLEDKNVYDKSMTKERREGMYIAKKILDLLDKDIYDANNKTFRKISFGDFAILGRNNEFLKGITRVLLEYKIPITSKTTEDLSKNKDIGILLALLKIINNSHDDINLTIALNSFFGNLTLDELSLIRLKYNEEKFFYKSVQNFLNDNDDGLIKEKLRKFFLMIDDLRFKISTSYTIYSILNYLQNQFDYLSYFKSLPDGSNREQSVKDFINSFKNAQYNNDLSKYISYLKTFSKDGRFEKNLSSNQDSVKIGTIHASKGLEYPIVFLVGIDRPFSHQTFNSEVIFDKELGLGVCCYDSKTFEKKDNFARNAIYINQKAKEKSEEIRLLYVGLTRAKNHLFLVGHTNFKNLFYINNSKQSQNSNCFLNWILSGLTELGFNNLVSNKKSFVDENKDYNVSIEVLKANDFIMQEEKTLNIDFLNTQKFINNPLNDFYYYQFKKPSNIAIKNTVSSMLQEYSKENDLSNYTFSPKKLNVFENESFLIDYSKLGTIYHEIMQKVEFENAKNIDEKYIENLVKSLNLEENYLKAINQKSILKCIKEFQKFDIISCVKEQYFISYLPYNEIFNNSLVSDKILIQGVADIILKTKKGYILIDYKTNLVSQPIQLIEKYKLQLNLYKFCLEKSLNIKFVSTYIYSFCLNCLIEIKQ